MVEFSAILFIVLSGLFFIDNYTEGNYRLTAAAATLQYSESVEEPKNPEISPSEKSTTDIPSIVGNQVKYANLTCAESKNRSESIKPVSEIDLYPNELRSLNNNSDNDTNLSRSFHRSAEINGDLSFDGREIEAPYIGFRNSSGELIRDTSEPVATLGINQSSGNCANERIDESQQQRLIEPATLPIGSEDSFSETRETNRSSMSRAQTLIDFIGPVITRDAECLEDQGLTNSEHIRVKRGSKSPHDDFNSRNVYPELNEPLDQTSGQLVRKKRLNYEMLLPKENSAPEVPEGPELDKELIDDDDSFAGHKTNPGPEYTGNPVFFESYSRRENSMEKSSPVSSEKLSEVSDSGKDISSIFNPGENLTSYRSDVANSGENEIGNRYYSERRRKRQVRVKRRGGVRGRRRKSKHHGKRKKKKKKKGKKPGGQAQEEKTESEYEASSKREVSRFVDELQVEAHVEKRDSGDARSEIDLSKREISGDHRGSEKNQLPREKRALQTESSSEMIKRVADSQRSGCRSGELRYYDDVWEPDVQIQRIKIKPTKPDSVEYETRKERAANSVRQIKKLTGKLIDEVDDLDTILNSPNGEESKKEKKRAGDFSNSSFSVEGDDFKRESKDRSGAKVCRDESGSSVRISEDPTIVKTDNKQGEENRPRRTLRCGNKSKKRRIRKRKSHRKWDRWTDWSSCSVTCGKGRQIRWRHCIHDCTNAETEMEEKSCQLPACSPGKFLGIF